MQNTNKKINIMKPTFTLLLLFFAFIGITETKSVMSQPYDPTNIAVINSLIANNGLIATPDAPETWDFALWNQESPRKITYLRLRDKNLTGMISFAGLTALTELNCDNNDIIELDVTNNPALTFLDCSSTNLTKLDLTYNIALITLLCMINQQLVKLDVTKNIALETLWCGGNNFTELNLTNNIALESFSCWGNNLTELVLTNNTALNYLRCSENKLTTLNVTNNILLETLYCQNNNLTNLNLTNNTALRILNCGFNNFIELDVINNTSLISLYCANNYLSELNVTNNIDLGAISCGNNNLTKLDLTGLNSLVNFWGNDQNKMLKLWKNPAGGYTCNISLNTPKFSSNAISYSGGVLKSTNKNVTSTTFFVQTNKAGFVLSGTMNFVYSDDEPPIIIVPNLTDGKLGSPYGPEPLKVSGDEPIFWEITDGKLPNGLRLNQNSGIISGKPTRARTFTFTVKATNSSGSASKVLSIWVEALCFE